MNAGGFDAVGAQGRDLIVHQGQQRRDHHRRVLRHDRRNLVAQGLPRPGRHYRQQAVAAGEQADDLLLPRPEGAVAEDIVENLGS